jgi:hypothetical protein
MSILSLLGIQDADQELETEDQAKTPSRPAGSELSSGPNGDVELNETFESMTPPASNHQGDSGQVSADEHAEEPELNETEVRLLAYFLWEARDDSHRSPEDDWFRARKELQERKRQLP